MPPNSSGDANVSSQFEEVSMSCMAMAMTSRVPYSPLPLLVGSTPVFILHSPPLLSPPSSCGCKLTTSILAPSCKLPQYPASSPPCSKQEAFLQARTSLSSLLHKSLRPRHPSPSRHLHLTIELPLLHPSSNPALASLLLDLFAGFSISKRASPLSLAVFCDPALVTALEAAHCPAQFQFCSLHSHVDLVQDAQVVVFLAPKLSQIAHIENVAKLAAPRPLVLLNPEWSAEEEADSPKAPFLQSFEVVYSYLPLAIQGFFSKTEGAVLKHVRGGAPAGTPWLIFVKDGDQLKCVASLKQRPGAVDLENALYNSMAANSPVTKSISFLRGLVGRR